MADTIESWLESLDLGKYAQAFAENEISLAALPYLTDDDLKEIGVGLGARRVILASIATLRDAKGADLPAPPETGPTTAPAKEAERRQLTVMFCDLVGSTELSQRLDPEDLREVMALYQEAVSNAIGEYEGYVAKFLGDGVLAYFGWPQAHEDQAERALHAARTAISAIAKLGWEDETSLEARVGIASGQVVIGDIVGETASETGAIAGETPNLAARLQALAEPGAVVIDAATQRLAGHAFELRDQGEHSLKGFAQPVRAWRVADERQATSRFEAARGESLTKFVGRDRELDLLRDRWGLATNGDGQAVLLSGEPGIGKSRILREFTEDLSGQGHAFIRFQCSPLHGNAAFHPIVEYLQAAARFKEGDTAQAKSAKLKDLLATDSARDPESLALIAALLSLPPDLFSPISMGPQRQKLQTIDLLAAHVRDVAKGRPLLALIEDLHWVDPSTMETFDSIIDQARDWPILVLATFRPEIEPPWESFEYVIHCALQRLTRHDGKAVAERVAGGKALPGEVIERILEQTDGVPLFVEELTKTVLEAGFLEETAGGYVLNGPLPALAIPSTLQGSLMARLDRLAPVKEVIQAAACIGREFSAELLESAVSMPSGALRSALDELQDAGLIFRRGTVEDATFIFKHALVQDAAYESLLKRNRQAIHARLASALESSAETDPLLLARHYAAAGLATKSAGAYIASGKRLLGASALPEAAGALELGLDQISVISPSPERDGLELDLRVTLGAARMATFGWAHPSVSDALEPAFPLAQALEETQAMGSILWGLWVHYQTRTEFPRAHEWLSELESAAQADGASDLPAVYDMSAGCQYFWEADYVRAVGHTDHLKTIYDEERHAHIASLTNHDPLVFSQHWAGSLADWIRGYPAQSVERLDEAHSHARNIGHPFNLVFALTAGATSLHYLDETDRLLRCCEEAERVVAEEALGVFSEQVLVMQWRGGAYIQQGEFERGHPVAKKGNDHWTNSGGRICTAMFRSWVVRGLSGLSRITEAMALNAGNIAHCRETGDRFMEAECVRLQGELALRIEPFDPNAAGQLFEEAITIARAQGAKSWELRAAMSLARVRQSQDRATEALAALEPTFEWFKQGLETTDLRHAAALLDELS